MILEEVLDGGRALRALYPQLDTVAFVDHWSAGYGSFDLFLYDAEGHFTDLGRGPRAHLVLGRTLTSHGYWRAAREHLAAVVPSDPDDAELRYMYAFILDHEGDRGGAVRELQVVIRWCPGVTLAARARALLPQLR